MRFCLLHHTGWSDQGDHYDVLLQNAVGSDDNDRVLKTYSTLQDRFPDGLNEGSPVLLCENHRRLYLTYQGEVPGNRGRVRCADSGEMEWLPQSKKYQPELHFLLFGKLLNGHYVIRNFANAEQCVFLKCAQFKN